MEHVIANLLQDFERGKMTRRQLIQSLAVAATAASAVTAAPAAAADNGSVIQAVGLNHVSYQVADYKKTRDWYVDLFKMKVAADDGKKADVAVGESLLALHTRPSPDTPVLDHICFTLANWDEDKGMRDKVEAELKRRGLDIQPTPNSFFVKDPDGLRVQIGGKNQ